jgi:hypothetical protein
LLSSLLSSLLFALLSLLSSLCSPLFALSRCANFPYNGEGTAEKPDNWLNYNMHTIDYGSFYNYYCPAGVAFPIKTTGTKCAGGFVNNDPYLASEEEECPKLQLLDGRGNALPTVSGQTEIIELNAGYVNLLVYYICLHG